MLPGAVDGELADVSLAGDGGPHVQVDLVGQGAGLQVQGGAGGGLVDGDGGGGAADQVEGGAGGLVDHLFQVAGQGELGVLAAVQHDLPDAHAVAGVVLHKAVGADGGLLDGAVALHPQGDLLAPLGVDDQLLGVHVPQDDAVVAVFTDAAAADHDLAQHPHVFQQDAAQVHAVGDVEVAGHHRVPQGHAGGGDGHVAVHAVQGVHALFLNGVAHGVDQQHGGLAPGDGPLGAEGAVGVAADQMVAHGLLHQAPAPLLQIPAVGKAGVLPGVGLQAHVPGQDDHCLLPGELSLGGEGGGGGAGDVVFGIRDGHVLGVPVGVLHVGKGGLAHDMVAEGPVDDGDELGPGDGVVGAQVAVDVAPHKAPVHYLLHGLVHGNGRGPGQGGRDQAQDQHQCQQAGNDPAAQ